MRKKLLVTGASGFLGWNLCQAAKSEWETYGTVFSHDLALDGVKIIRTDLSVYDNIRKVFAEVSPEAVIHAAAASDPNYCQQHREISHRINVNASADIAGLCADMRIPLVFTSTDLVFDGLNAPYREDDPVCPVNTYGEQKVIAEEEIIKRYPNATICRMALMFGPPSPVSESFLQPLMRNIREGRETRLFTDEFRNPASASTAVQGLFIAVKHSGGILHVGGAERISRYAFGTMLASLMGFPDTKLIPSLQKDVIMAAPRAPDVTLDISRVRMLGLDPAPLRDELAELCRQGL